MNTDNTPPAEEFRLMKKSVIILSDQLDELAEQRDRLAEQLDAILLRLGKTQERMIDAERQRDLMASEMRRYLPVLQHLENSPAEWIRFTHGLGVATLNGYRAAIPPTP